MRRLAIGLVCTIASVALLVVFIDWQDALRALRSADPWFTAAAVVALLLSVSLKALRWAFLLPADADVSKVRLYRILYISFMLNNVLPARLGDVARLAMTAQQPKLRVGHVISSLLTERVTDIVTLLASFLAVSPFLPLPARYRGWVGVAWWAFAALAAMTLLIAIIRRPVSRLARRVRWPGGLSNPRFQDEARSFGEGWSQLYSRRRLLPIWGLSGAAWVGAFAINYLLMRALDIHAPLTVAVLLTCVTNMAMLIPSSPGYIGVFHGAATLALLPFNVGASRALSFAILAHLVNVVPVTVLGALFLLAGRETLAFDWKSWRRDRPRDPSPAVGS
jgi:uncharacterized protein (TIRG00374 family)